MMYLLPLYNFLPFTSHKINNHPLQHEIIKLSSSIILFCALIFEFSNKEGKIIFTGKERNRGSITKYALKFTGTGIDKDNVSLISQLFFLYVEYKIYNFEKKRENQIAEFSNYQILSQN